MAKRSRNYKLEYERDHKPHKKKKQRAHRNAARAKMKKRYGFLDRMSEVDHIDGDPMNNDISNLRVTSRKFNRANQ